VRARVTDPPTDGSRVHNRSVKYTREPDDASKEAAWKLRTPMEDLLSLTEYDWLWLDNFAAAVTDASDPDSEDRPWQTEFKATTLALIKQMLDGEIVTLGLEDRGFHSLNLSPEDSYQRVVDVWNELYGDSFPDRYVAPLKPEHVEWNPSELLFDATLKGERLRSDLFRREGYEWIGMDDEVDHQMINSGSDARHGE
jgi:hypothetical protein